MKKFFFSFLCLTAMSVMAQTVKEQKLYYTDFTDWEAVASATTVSTKTVTTNKSNESLTFTFSETTIAPTGTNTKFTNTEVVTTGYAQSSKTATPYIETSVLASVTKVIFVQAATGGTRGWGMKVKGDGDTDWVTIYSTYATQAGKRDTVSVNRTNCQIRFYNLNSSQNGYLLELGIYGNVTEAPRTFVDFKIDFRTNPYTVVAPAEGLPAGVTIAGTSFNGSQHGIQNGVISVPVDGPVKFTIGSCQYGSHTVTVSDGTKVIATIDNNAGCENGISDIASATYTKFVDWTYNVEAPDTLTFTLNGYMPFFIAEACEYVANVKVTYFDQNNNKLGEEEVAPGTAFKPAYTIADLPAIAEGKTFRGWYSADGIKAPATINKDMIFYAKVTDIETPAVGTHYVYDLTKASFYMEDHELIAATGKQHGSGHGFVFQNGQEMTLIVAPKSYISVGLCTYTKTSDQIIRNAAGDSVAVMHVIRNGEAGAISDGAICSFYNESATTDTLHFNFTIESYIHKVEVYNVAAQLNKTGHVYDITTGDAATFMMVAGILETGDTIQLHDGLYDLGETTLTTIGANNIVVRGETMNGTIIKNAPDAKLESIDKTATIVNTGSGNVFENLTIQNALDYYKANNGRAVCLWDKGDKTACYNVRLLSYQDTYYSNKTGQQCWFEDCEIHGTVDYICGSGSVYFYNTTLFCEKRASTGGGSDCITASNSQTSKGDKGYVFDRCTIKSACPTVSFSRAWNDQPQVAFLLTTLDTTAGKFSLTDNSKIYRWTLEGMNKVVPEDFSEYNTMDADGNVISPASNNITFIGATNKKMETIIDYTAAEAKSYTHFFRDGWAPARNYVAFPEPAPAPADSTYYIKHPWGTGAAEDWTYKAMRDTVLNIGTMSNLKASYIVDLWGDEGFNIKNEAKLDKELWFDKALVGFTNTEGYIGDGYRPAKGDRVTFVYLHNSISQVVGGGQAWVIVPAGSALENVGAAAPATKRIENDRVVIIRGDKMYTITGLEIK